jgi:hypothetical protein
MRMITIAVLSGPEGFEHRTFNCSRCGHSETRMVASDSCQPGAAGWTAGDPTPLQPQGRETGDGGQRADIHQQPK